MTKEMKKRIEKGMNISRDKYGDGGYAEDFDEGFKAGAKFILKMPELREAIEVLWTCEVYGDGRTNMRVKHAMEALKKAGLCE